MDKRVATAATFGAGLTAMAIAPELQADIIELSFNPGSFAYQNSVSVSTTVQLIGASASFQQWNDSIGKTLFNFTGSLAVVSLSQTLNPGTFAPATNSIGLTSAASGTVYIGFNVGGNVGWFSLDAGGVGGTITYLAGAFGTEGESVHVGTIPSPAALALLALGATGIRRKRAA